MVPPPKTNMAMENDLIFYRRYIFKWGCISEMKDLNCHFGLSERPLGTTVSPYTLGACLNFVAAGKQFIHFC